MADVPGRWGLMRAQLAGECSRCPDPIRPGDDVVPHREQWIHARCASGADDDAPTVKKPKKRATKKTTTAKQTRPWISGFCNPSNPKDSHARCDGFRKPDGVPCTCFHHWESEQSPTVDTATVVVVETPAGGHAPDAGVGAVEIPLAGSAIPEDPTGFHLDIPEEEYHRHPTSVSQSGAKLLLQAPALFDHHRRHPVVKRIFDYGSAAHQKVLGVGPEVVVIQRTITDRKTGAVLDVIDAPDLRSTSAQEHQAQIRAEGNIPVTRKEYRQIEDMVEKLQTHTRAMELLSEGDAEVSAWCVDDATGVMRRARFDFLPPTICVDYKTSESADPWAFARNAVEYGYDIQDPFYLDLLEDLGHPAEAFCFIVQMKKPPYLVSVVELDEDSREHGRRRYERALEIFADCTKSGNWPGFVPDDSYQTVRIPDWALRNEGII